MNVARLQVFHGQGTPFSAEELPLDFALAEGEVLVAIDCATICGSDLHTIRGVRTEPTPAVLGHEAVGRVVRTGAGRQLAPSTRVTWSIADSCGVCKPCAEYDLPQKCERLFKYGHATLADRTGLNGCYASHVVLRRGTHIVEIPDELDDAIVAPVNCALATMVHAVLACPADRRVVVVQGGGLLGIYACALLRDRGASHIYCVERDKQRFSWIRRFGGTPIDGSPGSDPVRQIKHEHPRGVDAVFEVAGAKELFAQGIELLRAGGLYLLVGLVHPDSALGATAETLIRKCLTVRGVHNYAPQHLDEAVAFLQRTAPDLPYGELVSPPLPLERIQEAIELTASQRWLRVAIRPNGLAG